VEIGVESNIMRLSLSRDLILPQYAILALCSPRAMQHFHTRAKNAVAQTSINQEDVQSCRISYPTDLSEQRRIIDAVNRFNARIKTEEACRDKLKLQKRGLMHDLLTGRVRV
jgi:type I restriction enzyme S subunit